MTRIIIGGGLGGGLIGLLVAFASLILSLVAHHGWHLLWCDAFVVVAVDQQLPASRRAAAAATVAALRGGSGIGSGGNSCIADGGNCNARQRRR